MGVTTYQPVLKRAGGVSDINGDIDADNSVHSVFHRVVLVLIDPSPDQGNVQVNNSLPSSGKIAIIAHYRNAMEQLRNMKIKISKLAEGRAQEKSGRKLMKSITITLNNNTENV